MKQLNLIIEPPITEYCRNCDYECSYSLNSSHCQCPKCGNNGLSHGQKLPEVVIAYCDSEPRNYNFADYNDKSYQIYIQGCGIRFGTTFKNIDEFDFGQSTPLEIAKQMQTKLEKEFIYNSSKEKIKDIIVKLEKIEPEQKIKRLLRDKLITKEKIYKLALNLESIEYELEDLKNENQN